MSISVTGSVRLSDYTTVCLAGRQFCFLVYSGKMRQVVRPFVWCCYFRRTALPDVFIIGLLKALENLNENKNKKIVVPLNLHLNAS